MLFLRNVCNLCFNLHILHKICAAFTQSVQLVFESASFTQSIHAIIGSFTDIAKIVVLLLQSNLWLNLSIYAVLSRIRYCRDLRAFCVNFLTLKCRSRKSFDKYHVCCDKYEVYEPIGVGVKKTGFLGFPIQTGLM